MQVQNGCDHRCTFCIIPYGRGNSRSVPMGAVVDDVRRLVAHGYREIVLTGVDITSYGADLPGAPKLGTLIKQILKHVPELQRLRLSSIDSVEADRDLLDAFAKDARLMPHLHLSLQAGDDLILKRMKRRHLREDAIAFCNELRAAAAGHRVRRRSSSPASRPRRRTMFENSLDLVDGVRPDAPARLSVLAAAGHAGRAHAAGFARRIVKDRARRLRERGARGACVRISMPRSARRAACSWRRTSTAAPSSSRR